MSGVRHGLGRSVDHLRNKVTARSIRARQFLTSLTYFTRKTQRYVSFGVVKGASLPIAHLQFRCQCTAAQCRPYIASSLTEIATYTQPLCGPVLSVFKPTAAVTDVATFASMEAYLRAVSKASKGKYNRAANKARRLGYSARPIVHDSYGHSQLEILRSKQVRSWGLVYEAVSGAHEPRRDQLAEFVPPVCPEHWRIDWGLFHKDAPQKVVAYASLQRSGNFLSILHMMGHADVLALGGMKLLQFEIMDWVFNPPLPCAAELRYIVHGAIEHGSAGMADWRRYVQQQPMLLSYQTPTADAFPGDFKPRTYLQLNPDVRAANMSAKAHYLWHGWLEGRRYK